MVVKRRNKRTPYPWPNRLTHNNTHFISSILSSLYRHLAMASASLISSFCPKPSLFSATSSSCNPNSKFFPSRITNPIKPHTQLTIKALSLDFSASFFEKGIGEGEDDDDEGSIAPFGAEFGIIEDREEPQCPPGLRQYETMVVLRPDMSEDERLNLTQKYEELLIAGGGMYVEVFNRGVIPLAYDIQKKNKAGESNTYMDGIYLLFTYFTKPESMTVLESRLNTDDDVIRTTSFKIRKRKY